MCYSREKAMTSIVITALIIGVGIVVSSVVVVVVDLMAEF